MVLNQKHFTATTFVLHPKENKILLHWHKKIKSWLPPGGHIEKNETPEEAAIREVYEESGLSINLLSSKTLPKNLGDVTELEKPESILLEPIADPIQGKHFHIDMIYFAEAVNPKKLNRGWLWVSEKDLLDNKKIRIIEDEFKSPPNDVRILAIECINKRRNNGY